MAKFKATKQGKTNQKNRMASKIKKKAIGRMTAGGKAAGKGDARNRIIARSKTKMVDARDKLATLAKETDARAKLVKIRNLKNGIFDVKKTKKGGITITTTTKGTVQLVTKHKEKQNQKQAGNPNIMVSKVGKNLTKKVTPTGEISLSTKAKTSALAAKKPAKGQQQQQGTASKNKNVLRGVQGKNAGKVTQITKTIKGNMSRKALLDEELLNTHVDPVVIRRTVKQDSVLDYRSNSRPALRMERSRSRSPPTRRYHYDDPRSYAREEEILRQRIRTNDSGPDLRRQMSDNYPTGTKVVVSNLHETVTTDDLQELFGDIGKLQIVKMSTPGTADITFLHKEHAEKAIEVYHNRQLDGQPMKCHLVVNKPRPTIKASLASSSRYHEDDYESRRAGYDDVSYIHKALFSERKSSHGSALPFASGSGSSSAADNRRSSGSSGNNRKKNAPPKKLYTPRGPLPHRRNR